MSTKSYTLICTISEIIMFKVDENVFFPCAQGDNRVFEAQITIFLSRCRLWDFIFLFLGELGTCLLNTIPTKMWNIENALVPT
jgi:hypothetical protein